MDRFVSIIIPVFNDRSRLKICLAALEKQTWTKNCYEVIVVDNGSTQSITDIVEQFPQAKLTCCNTPGSMLRVTTVLRWLKGKYSLLLMLIVFPNQTG